MAFNVKKLAVIGDNFAGAGRVFRYASADDAGAESYFATYLDFEVGDIVICGRTGATSPGCKVFVVSALTSGVPTMSGLITS